MKLTNLCSMCKNPPIDSIATFERCSLRLRNVMGQHILCVSAQTGLNSCTMLLVAHNLQCVMIG